MIHQRLMTLLIVVGSGCAHARGAKPPVRTWSIQPDDGYCMPVEAWCQGQVGLVRKQDKITKSFKDSKDYIAMTLEDLQQLIATCPKP